MQLVLGIDGGGTGCRAAAATSSGEIVGRGKGGPANIRTDLAGARDSIVAAARMALSNAGHDPNSITTVDALLGLAGTNVGDYKEQLRDALPFRQSVVETDSLIALEGALGGHDGAIAALGTGTVYLGRRHGVLRPLAGWGFQISDLGSGARIGRDLLQEALLVHDRIHPASPAAQKALDRFDNDPGAMVEFTLAAKPADFGTFAPLVFDGAAGGDPYCIALVKRAVADIEEALDVFDLSPPQRLCLLGGLGPLYAPLLSARHRSILHEPISDALGGAVALAIRRFGPSTDHAHG